MDVSDHETIMTVSESDSKNCNDKILSGSISYRYIYDIFDLHLNNQQNYKLELAEGEVVLLKVYTNFK